MTSSGTTFLPTAIKIRPAILELKHVDGQVFRKNLQYMHIVQRTLSKAESVKCVQQGSCSCT
jgi:hypothetical protein